MLGSIFGEKWKRASAGGGGLAEVLQPPALGQQASVGRHRTAGIGQQASDSRHRAPGIGQQASDSRHRAPGIGQQASDSRHQAAGTGSRLRWRPRRKSHSDRHRAESVENQRKIEAGVGQQASDSRHRATGIGQQASDRRAGGASTQRVEGLKRQFLRLGKNP